MSITDMGFSKISSYLSLSEHYHYFFAKIIKIYIFYNTLKYFLNIDIIN